MFCRDDQCDGGSDHYDDGVQLSHTFLVFTACKKKSSQPCFAQMSNVTVALIINTFLMSATHHPNEK